MKNNANFKIINFEEYVIQNKEMKNFLLISLECKHIPTFNNNNKIWLNLANKVGYKWAIFGSHRLMPEEQRLQYEIERVNKMYESAISRPIRIVKTSNSMYFIDNTHWALAYLKRYGLEVKLIKIPFYIIDFTQKIPLVVDVNNSVIKEEQEIKNAITAANEIETRVLKGWRNNNCSYTLKDFITELKSSFKQYS